MFLRSLNRISAPLFASAANPTFINVNAISGKLLRASYATKEVKISWEDTPYKTHKCDPPPTSAVTNKEELLRFYKDMYLMRRIELLSDQLYKAQLIRGFLHLYTGQEAVCVGMEAALTHKDHIITAYRDHTIYLGRGGTSTAMLAELLGRANGCAKGKGGSMHMYKADTNFYGGNGIVGAQVPVGTGIAMAQQYLNTGNVCVTMFGDGAANQGQVFEAFNMAALWKLPVIYVVENNHYAMGTSTQRSYSGQEYYTRGDYIPGIKVDGMDVLAVKSAFQYSVDFVKSKGPILLEMNTYRYAGHSMSDPGTTYRSRAEIDKVRESRDPLNKTKDRLLKHQLATEEEILAIEKEIKEVLNQAVAEAKAGPEPDLKETYTEVYIEPTPIRGVELSNSYHP